MVVWLKQDINKLDNKTDNIPVNKIDENTEIQKSRSRKSSKVVLILIISILLLVYFIFGNFIRLTFYHICILQDKIIFISGWYRN